MEAIGTRAATGDYCYYSVRGFTCLLFQIVTLLQHSQSQDNQVITVLPGLFESKFIALDPTTSPGGLCPCCFSSLSVLGIR